MFNNKYENLQSEYYDYVDGIESITYNINKDKGFGFIKGFKCPQQIFFHINTLKSSNLKNIISLIQKLKNNESSDFPFLWFIVSTDKYGRLFVKSFLTDNEFNKMYKNQFMEDFGKNFLKKVKNSEIINLRKEELLKKLIGNDEYQKIIYERYNHNNSISNWSLGLITPYKDHLSTNNKYIEDVRDIFCCGYKPKYEIINHLQDKLSNLGNIDNFVPIFFKIGKNLIGKDVATDIHLYDRNNVIENSNEKQIKSFIKEKYIDPIFKDNQSLLNLCLELFFSTDELEDLNTQKEQKLKDYQLKLEKERIEQKKRKILFEQEQQERQEQLKKIREEYEIKENEYKSLLAEIEPLGFTLSSEVSNYILSHNLKNKYGRISGNIEMANGSDHWNFNGGIDPRYYKRLCDDLGLGNKNSSSIPVKFIPYNN